MMVRTCFAGWMTNKDQTYFLATVAREHFERVLFPIGGLAKPMVREIDAAPVCRTTSAGFTDCFIGEREFSRVSGALSED